MDKKSNHEDVWPGMGELTRSDDDPEIGRPESPQPSSGGEDHDQGLEDPPIELRCSSRSRKPPTHFQPGWGSARAWKSDQVAALALTLEQGLQDEKPLKTEGQEPFMSDDWNEIISCLAEMDMELSLKRPRVDHALDVSLKAKTAHDPDSPSFTEAITGEYADEYWKAMDEEVRNLEKRGTWTMIPRKSIGTEYPQGPVLPGTWVLKCKRKVDYSFRKFKG